MDADKQRLRVYKFENKFIDYNRKIKKPRMNPKLISELINKIFNEYDYNGSYVITFFSSGAATATGYGGNEKQGRDCVHINFPVGCRTMTTVLHEVSHILGEFNHGPIFLTMFFQLLTEYMGYDEMTLRRQAIKFGLDIAPRNTIMKRKWIGDSRKSYLKPVYISGGGQ